MSSKRDDRSYPLERTDAEWREILDEDAYRVLRKAGTERPGSSPYTRDHTVGVYRCRGCDTELFRSAEKFDAHCGWPSFWAPLAGDRVELRSDWSLLMKRTEVLCAACGGHLGHVFRDSPQTPTGERFCINGVALRLEPAES